MVDVMPILAASEFDVVIGIIFLLFWAVAAIAGKLKGKNNPQEQQHQQPDPAAPPGETAFERMQREIAEQLQQMQGGARQAPPPLPPTARPVPPPARQMPTTARPVPPMRQQPVRQPQRRPKRQPARPVQVFADVPPPPPPPPLAVPAAVPVTPRPATVTAPVIRRWLQPATLRQQFILTELFQPPMSMRNERF